MNRVAVIGAVLENPSQNQKAFNETVSEFRKIIKGRMAVPFDEENAAVISITLLGELDEINALTGKLGNLRGVTVKAAVSNALKGAEQEGRYER
ncbi:MAG: iron-only hydrogenase system regulator [Spirochaetaceae bacterium]|jgi:putative iron-only hydrogenase system regulator|nr:iron-only hydrogenase system regulator [Spirochaetaceae bacterium]